VSPQIYPVVYIPTTRKTSKHGLCPCLYSQAWYRSSSVVINFYDINCHTAETCEGESKETSTFHYHPGLKFNPGLALGMSMVTLLFQSLEKERLKEAFLAEELQCKHCPESTTGSEAVLFASGTSCKCLPTVSCSFCKYSNHCIHKCQNLVKANYLSQKGKHSKKGVDTANKASDASTVSFGDFHPFL